METKGQNILITGGSGLVGRQLTNLLLNKGYNIAWLSRSKGGIEGANIYLWDTKAMTIDAQSIEWADIIVHLAGEGVANSRWTDEFKGEMYHSRTDSTKLLYQAIEASKNPPSRIISASAIGYYGLNHKEKPLYEHEKPGSDFLADMTRAWEEEVDKIAALKLEVTKLRIGIVLCNTGGALEKMCRPIKLGMGAVLGKGDQIVSWIHILDLCGMIEYILENHITGVYNAVSPKPVTNKEMMKSIANHLNRPFFLPPVPPFMLKIMIGEMSEILLKGSNVSSEKIQKAGYKFNFPVLKEALNSLL